MEVNAREFKMSKKNFATISEVIYQHSGIVLKDIKKDMVYSRVSRRIRQTSCRGFDDYLNLALQQDKPEFTQFVNAITTNLTAFFRESHHFDFISNKAIAEWKSNPKRQKLRIWSAGSSAGEEAYSIAITLSNKIPSHWDTKILATDIDTNVITHAQSGVYTYDRVSNLSAQIVSQHFDKLVMSGIDYVQLKKKSTQHDFL